MLHAGHKQCLVFALNSTGTDNLKAGTVEEFSSLAIGGIGLPTPPRIFPGGGGVAGPQPGDTELFMQLAQTLLALLQSRGGAGTGAGGPVGGATMAPVGAPAAGAPAGDAGSAVVGGPTGPMSAQEAAGAARGGLMGARQLGRGFEDVLRDTPTVAVIDDFSRPGSHGDQIASLIENGDPDGGAIRTMRYNIANGGDLTSNIAGSLDDVLRRVQNGQKVDAVNLSQQNFQASGSSQALQDRIARLQEAGVPVVVAAGNGGSGQQNQLARGAAFVVENSNRGSENRAQSSGTGNIRAEGQFTSQAAATVSARVAKAHSQGASPQQINQTVRAQAAQEGGSLNAR